MAVALRGVWTDATALRDVWALALRVTTFFAMVVLGCTITPLVLHSSGKVYTSMLGFVGHKKIF